MKMYIGKWLDRSLFLNKLIKNAFMILANYNRYLLFLTFRTSKIVPLQRYTTVTIIKKLFSKTQMLM